MEHLLEKNFSPGDIEQICDQLMVNLSPITYRHEHSRVPRAIEAGGAVNASAPQGLGGYLRTLAQEFPILDRQSGRRIKDHPLKVLNDTVFRPMFQEIVTKASDGELTARADLNIGGHWYRVPNILVDHPDRDPWENVDNCGRVVAQIHYDKSYDVVRFSLVLQYNVLTAAKTSAMPRRVSRRYHSLCSHLERQGTSVSRDLPPFRHWTYKENTLWAKPIVSHGYSIASLPPDDELRAVLRALIDDLNEAMTMR